MADAKRTGGMRARALGDAIGVRGPQPEPRDVLTSVSRALAVLEAIAASPQPIPAKAVARQLGISLGTSYHVLHTLEHAGYVVRLGQGRFGLGSKVPALYHLFREQLDLVPTVRPLLGELSERAGEDAYLAVFRAGEVVVAEVVEGPSDLHLEGLGEGFSRIAHSTALGKVLLAAAPEAVVDGYLEERRLEPFTRRTLVRRKHIKRHLAAVQERGIGTDLEELADGCCCVAVPILDARGEAVAAVGLSTTSDRWRAERDALVAMCRETAAHAGRALGGSRPAGPW